MANRVILPCRLPADHGRQQFSSFSGSSQAASSSQLSAFLAGAARKWRKTMRKVPSPSWCDQRVLDDLPFGCG
jgi:hypothetical protein